MQQRVKQVVILGGGTADCRGMRPDRLPLLEHQPDSVFAAQSLFADVRPQQQLLAATLPANYEYLRRLHPVPAAAR